MTEQEFIEGADKCLSCYAFEHDVLSFLSKCTLGQKKQLLLLAHKRYKSGPGLAVVYASILEEGINEQGSTNKEKWLSMDSAPKDGTAILVYCPEYKEMHQVIADVLSDGRVRWMFGHPGYRTHVTPSCWQTLPEGPKEEE